VLGYAIVIGFTSTYYQGAILERENTNMLDYNITFINTLVSSTKDVHKIAYIKGQVKPQTCYLTIKKEI